MSVEGFPGGWLKLAEVHSTTWTPRSVLRAVPGLAERLASLDAFGTLATLAGFQTDPAYAANAVRLDMALRLVRICSSGSEEPRRDKLFRLLNRDLADCGVNRLEDPPEDDFLTTVATRRGTFRLFQGVWEKAGALTEDVISAFGHLPPTPWGARAFDSAHDLLALSDLLAHRAGLFGRTAAEGRPVERLALPRERNLANFAGRCLVSWTSLATLGATPGSLSPFMMDERPDAAFGDALPGGSELERRPLAAFREGILVVAPHNLSTAMRAHLIEVALENGSGDQLRVELLQKQSERVTLSGFAGLRDLPVQSLGGHPVKQTVSERSPGRPVHILQLVDDFAGAPPVDFVSMTQAEPIDEPVARAIGAIRGLMRCRSVFQRGLTIVLLGGWGRTGGISLPMDDADWDVIAVEPEDAAAMCLAGGGSIMDLWRLHSHVRMIEAQGFDVLGANGWINLFALWRQTNWALIPEHETDFQPPAVFTFPTELVLKVRQDAARRNDRRSLPLPSGRFDIVARLNRDDFSDPRRTSYVSIDGVQRGEMLGVVLGRRPVWLRLASVAPTGRSFDAYETWKAALHWLEIGMPAFDEEYAGADRGPVYITLEIEWPADRFGNPVDDDAIDSSLHASFEDGARTARLHLDPAWQHGLHRPDNYAEMRLAAEMFSIVGALIGHHVDVMRLFAMMRGVVGADDIRWRHSFVADRPLTLMDAHGMIATFQELPDSAGALARCGSTFLSRPRDRGAAIHGSDDCFTFLMEHHDALLGRLCGAVRVYGRIGLVEAAVSKVVAALIEEQRWTLSARAMRALHGAEHDMERSLRRRNQINAVIRGGSMIAEIASSEAAVKDGREAGDADLDELMTQAMLLFQTAELIPPVRAGFMEPRLEISPTGDLLHDHGFTQSALVPSVHLRHAERRADADGAYRSHFDRDEDAVPIDPKFEEAVEAEYAMPFDAFLAFSGACAELAIARGSPVLRMTRSELVDAVSSLPGYGDIDLATAIDELTLPSRDGWSTLADGTVASDFDLSRFDRHLSLIRRPLIGVGNGVDPMLIVSPPLIERAALHNLGGGIHGGLQGRFWSSEEMRRYVGGAAEKKGLEFNELAAGRVRALGPTAFASVKLSDALAHRGTDVVKRLGDIDVLALSPDGRHAWVIEAKDIRFCRTLGETTSRLGEYRGRIDRKGRRDNLRKHLDRVEYVRDHRDDLAKRYGLPTAPTIHGLVVFDSPQPMAFIPTHGSSDARFALLQQLNGLDWTPPGD